MPQSIEQRVRSITEDRRAEYCFDTKVVAEFLRIHPNKFHARWYRTRDWLIEIALVQPGQLAAEVACILALAEAERQRRDGGGT